MVVARNNQQKRVIFIEEKISRRLRRQSQLWGRRPEGVQSQLWGGVQLGGVGGGTRCASPFGLHWQGLPCIRGT